MNKFYFNFWIFLLPFIGMGQWGQLGVDLIGDSYTPDNNFATYFGHSVAFSDDGSTMVVGAPGVTCTTCNFQSYAQVYKNINGNWVQFGEDILGGSPFLINTIPPRAGFSVDVSSDGSIIAISETNYYEVFEDQLYRGGRVRVFQLTDNGFVQLGDSIGNLVLSLGGVPSDDSFGHSISLSEDGLTLAIGSRFYTPSGAGSSAGRALVYKYSSGVWNQIGSDIYGITDYEYLGSKVELSGDGNILAVSAPGNAENGPYTGEIQLFEFVNNQWNLINAINGATGRVVGNTFALSKNGNALVLSSSNYSLGNYTSEGNVKVFTKENGIFIETASMIGQVGQRFGGKVTISNDGTVLGITSGAFSGNFMNQIYSYKLNNGVWEQVGDAIYFPIPNGNFYYQELAMNADGSILGIGNYDYKSGNHVYSEGRVLTFQNCSLANISVLVDEPEAICVNDYTILTVSIAEELYQLNGQVFWYTSEDASEPIFEGTEFETPSLAQTTTYWVEAFTPTGCSSERQEVVITVIPTPELSIQQSEVEICENSSTILTVSTNAGIVKWYETEDASQPIFEGTEFETPNLTQTTTYWVSAETSEGCISVRQEITVTILPLPTLEAEILYNICGNDEAYLYAYSEGNVVFWYANEDDVNYLYHGNNFITEELTENSSFWVEAYNIATGCKSERIEVVVNVNPTPSTPIDIDVQFTGAGQTLADLEAFIQAEGELTWYADEDLTIVLPNTTIVLEDEVYYVTQTINGCESNALMIEFLLLGNSNLNSAKFSFYPNPVKDRLNFSGKEKVQNVQIFDLSGKLVYQNQQLNGINSVQLNVLKTGTYIVNVKTDKSTQSFKIVKK